MKKYLALLLAAIMLMSVLAGCADTGTTGTGDNSGANTGDTNSGTQTGDNTGTNTPQVGGDTQSPESQLPEDESKIDYDASVIYNLGWGPDNVLNPYLCPTSDYMRHITGTPLVLTYTTFEGEWGVEYMMAESVEPNADKTEWTVKIREGMKWHDGEAYNADDVVYSINVLWKDPEFLYGIYYTPFGDDVVATKIDDLTLTIKTDEENPDMLEDLDMLYVAPEHIYSQYTGEALNTLNLDFPVSNGPFMYVDHVDGEFIQLTRFDDYFQPAMVKNLRIQLITEDSIAVSAMKTGEINITRTWDSITAELDKTEGVNVYRAPEARQVNIFMNLANSAFKDIYVRKAFACLIDNELICSAVLGGMGNPRYTPYYDKAECYTGKYQKEAFSIEQAKQYMIDGGYTLDSEGYFAKDGERVWIDWCHTQGPGSEQEKVGLAIQAYAKQAGIYMTVNSYDSDTWSTLRTEGTFHLLGSDYVMQGSTVAECVADYWSYFGSPDRYGAIYYGEHMETIDAIGQAAEEASLAGDTATALAKAEELEKYLMENVIMIPFYGYVTAYSSTPGVHIEDCCYDELQFLNRIWVEK